MMQATAEPVGRRGRPRHLDDETERRLLLDTAMDLLRDRAYGNFGVADILAAAGLSTRSFYRHFESKEALHVALLRREIVSVVRRLTRLAEAAEDPVTAVESWIVAFLDTFFDPKLASRSAAFTTPAAMSMSPITEELDQIRQELCRPLVAALRRGHALGVIRSPDPDRDAHSIFGLVAAAGSHRGVHDRATAREQVVRFAWPALGLDVVGKH